MTTDQMRIAVAESLGWKEVWHEGEMLLGFTPSNDTKTCRNRKYPVPNFPADLNAMHEAEKALTEDEQERMMEHIHYLVRDDWAKRMLKTTEAFEWCICHATAAQRCEAYLRVKGLWKEDAK